MNNIPQKNVLFGFRESNLLPYGKSDVRLLNNQSINQINVNNSLQQLRDNDLYLENEMNYLSSYTAGPKRYSDEISTTFVDGQKYWKGTDPTEQLSILHKVNVDPANTLTRTAGFSATDNVRYITRQSGIAFAGIGSGFSGTPATASGKIMYSRDTKSWGQLIAGASFAYFKDDEKILAGVDNSVYLLKLEKEVDSQGYTTLVVNPTEIISLPRGYPTAIHVREDGKIVVGTNEGKIYEGQLPEYDNLGAGLISMTETVVDVSDCGQINDIVFREYDDDENTTYDDGTFIMASSKNSILESRFRKSMVGEEWIFSGSKILDLAFDSSNKLYVCGENGLSSYSNGTVVQIESVPVYALYEYNGEIYYTKKSNYTDTQENIVVCKVGASSALFSFQRYKSYNVIPSDIAVVGTGEETFCFVGLKSNSTENVNGVYYRCLEQGKTKALYSDTSYSVLELDAKIFGDTIYVYVSRIKNSARDFVVYKVTRTSENFLLSWDSSTIEGLKDYRNISNSKNLGMYRYRWSGFVYADGSVVRDDTGRQIRGFNGEINFFKKIDSPWAFPDSGYIVRTPTQIGFMEESGNNAWHTIRITSQMTQDIPGVQDIKDILFNSDYAFLLTNRKVYLCGCTYDSNVGRYDFNVVSVYDSGSTNISKGCIMNNVPFILNGTSLVRLSIISYTNSNLVSVIYEIDTGDDDFEERTVGDINKIAGSGVEEGQILVAKGKNFYSFQCENPQDDENLPELITQKAFGSNVDEIQYGFYDDTTLIRVGNAVTAYGNLAQDTRYSFSRSGLYSMTFMNGNMPALACSDGIYAVADNMQITSFTNVGSIGTFSDWDFNQFDETGTDAAGKSRMFVAATEGDSGKIMLYSLSAQSSISDSTRRVQLREGTYEGLNHARVMMSEMLYTNVQYGRNNFETRVWGLSSQGDIEDYTDSNSNILLNGGVTGVLIDKIVPCCIDHALFINGTGIFIDGYLDSAYTRKLDDDGEHFMFPNSGSLLPVMSFMDGDVFRNVDTTYSYDDSAMMVGVNLASKVRFIQVNIPPKTKTQGGNEYTLTPSPLKDSNIDEWRSIDVTVKLGSSSANMKKALFRHSDSEDNYQMYVLASNNSLYLETFNTRGTDNQVVLNSSNVLMTGIYDIMRDPKKGTTYALKSVSGGYDIYQVDTGRKLNTSVIPNTNFRGIGQQEELGFVFGSGTTITQYIQSRTSKTVEKMNNTACKKIVYADDYTYILDNSNNLKSMKTEIASFLKSGRTFTQRYSGVQDFDAMDGTIYYVSTSNKKQVHVISEGTETEILSFERNINEIKCIENTLDAILHGAAQMMVKFEGDEAFSIVTGVVQQINYNSTRLTNVGNIVQNDDQTVFALQSGNVLRIDATNSTTVQSGSVSILIQSDYSFGFKNTGGNYFIRNQAGTSINLKTLISPTSGEEVIALRNYSGGYHGITNTHIRKQQYEKDYGLPTPVVKTFSNAVVEQISPSDNSADTFLISTDVNEGNKQRYIKYSRNADLLINFDVYGDVSYASLYDPDNPGRIVKSTDNQYFDKALNLIGSNNSIKLVKKNVNQFFCSRNGGELQEWYFDRTEYNEDIIKGFHNNGRFYIIVNTVENSQLQKIWTFEGYTDKLRAFEEIKRYDDANYNRFLKLGYNKYLLASDYCAYYVKDSQFMPNTYPGNGVGFIQYVDFGVNNKWYFYSIADGVYKSQNYKKMSIDQKRFVKIGSSVSRVNEILPKNEYEILFATDKGMFQTNYRYSIHNDLTYKNEKDVNDYYRNLLSSKIQKEIQDSIEEHMNTQHQKGSVMYTINNNIVDVDFSLTPAEWKKVDVTNSQIEIENDIVSEIRFGKSPDSIISVMTSNFVKDDTPDFNYILKRYSSGMAELYILVDTTNTYYINHVPGAGYSMTEDNNVGYVRKNLEKFGPQVSRIQYDEDENISFAEKFKTQISVLLDQNELSVERLLDYQVNGCSLPLKIYPDIDGVSFMSDAKISGMYQGLILQSQVKMFNENSFYQEIEEEEQPPLKCFKAECFGTDQQSIKIQFYDSTHAFDSNGFVIMYHGKGGIVGDDYSKTTYSQRFGLTDIKPLKKNMFKKYWTENNIEETFLGWSLSSVGDNKADMKHFDNMQIVSKEILQQAAKDNEGYVEKPFGTIKRGTVVHLYAVWQNYTFSASDTILRLQVGTENFSIDNYALNPSGQLKNTVMVNFGNPE